MAGRVRGKVEAGEAAGGSGRYVYVFAERVRAIAGLLIRALSASDADGDIPILKQAKLEYSKLP
jgi:hypothetical protein